MAKKKPPIKKPAVKEPSIVRQKNDTISNLLTICEQFGVSFEESYQKLMFSDRLLTPDETQSLEMLLNDDFASPE